MITITEEKIILNYTTTNLSSRLLSSDISFNYFSPLLQHMVPSEISVGLEQSSPNYYNTYLLWYMIFTFYHVSFL